jgi:hypothetical protein
LALRAKDTDEDMDDHSNAYLLAVEAGTAGRCSEKMLQGGTFSATRWGYLGGKVQGC